MSTAIVTEPLHSRREAAKMLGLPLFTVDKYLAMGKLREAPLPDGTRKRIYASSIEALAAEIYGTQK